MSAALKLLGGFQLTVEDRVSVLRARKSKALLAYLALEPAPHTRDELASLLWPTADIAAARQSLRQALSEIRRALGTAESCLVADADSVQLTTNGVQIDTAEFARLAGKDPQNALAHFSGDVLEGFDCRVDAYDEWLDDQRRSCKAAAVAACAKLAELYEEQNASDAAVEAYERLINLDRTNEDAYYSLMQLYIAAGKDDQAIKSYLALKAVLDRELGIPPNAEASELYESLLHHRKTEASKPIATPSPDKRLRPVTVMVVRPTALTGDPEAIDAAWQAIADTADAIGARYGGKLIHRRSNVGVIAFGLDQAHGTEADRARLAATELLTQCDDLAIALASGQVLFKVDSAEVTGVPLTLALDTAANTPGGQLWAHRSAKDSLRIPITASQVEPERFRLDPAIGPEDSVPLVGREYQVRQFLTALDACRDTAGGHALLVRGEAGIGKSRLVRECTELATREGAQVHVAQVLDFGIAHGNDPLAQLIRSFCRREEENETVSATTLAHLGVDAELAPFALDMLGQALSGTERDLVASMDVDARRSRRVDVIATLIAQAAERSTVLVVVEDIHWADRLVLNVISRLVPRITDHPALLVMTSRVEGEPFDPEWRSAMQGAPLTTIDLRPLREREAEVLAAKLGLDDAGNLIRRSGGNPLFLEQLAQSSAPLDAEVPDSVQSLAVARLDALTENANKTACYAAVFGQRFRREWVEACVPESAFAELVDSGLLQTDGESFRFHHALIRDGIYRNLLQAERLEMHERAARVFEREDPALYAEHLDRAENPNAATALIAAGRHEQENNRPSRALDYVNRAIRHEGAHRAEGLSLASELYLILGNPQAAIELLRGVGDDEPNAVRARAFQRLGAAENLLDHQAAAISHLEHAIELASGNDAILADAYLELGNALFPTGQVESCLAAHTASRQHAVKLGDQYRTSRALGGLGDAYYQSGLMRSANGAFAEAVQLANDAGYPSIIPANKAMHELTRLFLNETRAAIEGAAEALELAGRTQNLRHACLCHNVISVIAPFAGEYDLGLSHARACLDLAVRIGSRRFEADCHGQIAQVAALTGDKSTGAQEVAIAFELLGQDLLPFGGANLCAVAACCVHDEQAMIAELDRGAAMLSSNAVSHCHLFYYAMGIEACFQFGRRDRALRLAEGLAAYTEKEPLPWSDYVIRRARLLASEAKEPPGERAALAAIAAQTPFSLTV
jgi:DNA-binding SARP family transcriptional activator